MKIFSIISAILLSGSLLFIPNNNKKQLKPEQKPIIEKKTWADTLLKKMTLEEKIGQLFMVPVYSEADKAAGYKASIKKMIEEYHIGGVIFMQGTPEKQAEMVNYFQEISKTPLLVAQDAEWGINMRLKSVEGFPKNMTLGAIQNDSLLYEMGAEMAKQCKAVGVNFNFAPVVDINNNPKNPVINDRSFGENKYNVSKKAEMLIKGMENNKVLACAKHFPGHGDTDVDSHKDLPVIKHSRKRLDTLELVPFKYLIDAGLRSMMIAHLNIPALDNKVNQTSTLSKKIVKELLRDSLEFNGLVVTDALTMQGVAKYHAKGEIEKKALKAGNDILLFPTDVPLAIQKIKNAITRGEISEAKLDFHVLRILKSKEWLGLQKVEKIDTKKITKVTKSKNIKVLNLKLFEAAMTIAKNKDNVIPIKQLDTQKIGYLQIGSPSNSTFYNHLKKYTEVEKIYGGNAQNIVQSVKNKKLTTIIVGLYEVNKYAKSNFGVTANTKAILKALNETDVKVILTVFGSPYSLKHFGDEDGIVVAYENRYEAEIAAAEAVFGGIKATGKLPVTASSKFKVNQSEFKDFPALRIGFGFPESVGLDSRKLIRIDSIAKKYINKHAYPGCAVLVMRQNKIVYTKGFGKTTYKSDAKKIDPENTIYDLASVTKIMATTVSTMKLFSEGKFSLDDKISKYLPDLKGTNKENITIRRLLQHNSGMKSWLPFYTEMLDKEKNWKCWQLAESETDTHKIRICSHVYLNEEYQDTLWMKIVKSPVKSSTKMVYSDLNMIMMAKIIKKITGESLDKYAENTFYKKMGMDNTMFNPIIHKTKKIIPPTEDDTLWRKEVVQGFVHDQAAALFGGVSGHAGLFSNVYDIAKMLLMVKNGGKYGDMVYFDPKVVALFTKKQMPGSRKGLGWDKPEQNPNKSNPCYENVSPTTYGHTGFTGIGAWVDPVNDVVFIFLSNRTYPDMNNKLLAKAGVRPQIQRAIYDAIIKTKVSIP